MRPLLALRAALDRHQFLPLGDVEDDGFSVAGHAARSIREKAAHPPSAGRRRRTAGRGGRQRVNVQIERVMQKIRIAAPVVVERHKHGMRQRHFPCARPFDNFMPHDRIRHAELLARQQYRFASPFPPNRAKSACSLAKAIIRIAGLKSSLFSSARPSLNRMRFPGLQPIRRFWSQARAHRIA